MYQWLMDALQGPSTVITANRRLARVLQEQYAQHQLRAGKVAWQSPAIHSWQDWLATLTFDASDQASLPTRINQHQSELLWERCLNKEIDQPRLDLAGLVRLSRDTWQRLSDWRVTIREVARSAQNSDQRLFAAVAGRYLGILERERWVDDAGLGALVDDLIRRGRTVTAGRVTFVGFDRERPVVTSIKEGLVDLGCDVEVSPLPDIAESIALQCYETPEAELRAAGAWARALLEKNSSQTIAIIAGNLEQEALRTTHLVREGFVPGWQYAPAPVARAVNVSYGRNLIDFPAVSIALLIVRWIVSDLSAGEIGHLLRTPLFGSTTTGGRSRLELHLRQLPDRNWSPAMVSAALRGRDDSPDAVDWLGIVASLIKLRRELRKSASPAEWAEYIDKALRACHWPGKETLASFDFQLVNRWRDLLNDLARLDLVSPAMSLNTAIRRLELMAAETVFQAETEGSAVQLIGPLEASGAQFDAIWISGLSAANWPPRGNPSPLVSRQLQREKGMPDAEPSDTVGYAERLLMRLGGASRIVVCSYPRTQDDAEQTPSDLLRLLRTRTQTPHVDPGWHAATLARTRSAVVREDAVPKISAEEKVGGGSGTIQRQRTDPISAFIVGRLGVKSLQKQAVGLPAAVRGIIIHDALNQLYIDTPTRNDISSWSDGELSARIERATDVSFAPHERNADDVLIELFKLERRRVSQLLRHFVNFDVARGDFSIVRVEREVAFSEVEVRMPLRVDRIDRMPDGTVTIIDYKTGAKKKFLNGDGQPNEIQLVAYACALDEPVTALALANIDAREVGFDGAGRGYTDEADWQASLGAWQRAVVTACEELSRGDVRVNFLQGIQTARDFNLLSRYTELLRDG